MLSYPKLRKTIKWGGAAITLLLIVVWAASLLWWVQWSCSTRDDLRCIAGSLQLRHWGNAFRRSFFRAPGWYIAEDQTPPMWHVHFEHYKGFQRLDGPIVPDAIFIDLPLWLPALLTLAVTIPAWRLDALARRRGGLCSSCGYSLVGLPAGSTCPECGKPGIGSAS